MTPELGRRRAIRWGALLIGVIIFSVTLYYINFRVAFGTVRQLGVALPLALAFSGLWHLARTWAWAWCFPQPGRVRFLRLARIRLAAEAFSYLTVRGIAGEPLKVVLLTDTVDAREATAAVALERLAYLVGTTLIVGVGSVLALAGLPLTQVWFRVFRAFAIAAAALAVLTVIVVSGRGTYVQSLWRRVDDALGTHGAQGRIARFVIAVERQMLELVRGNPRRLAILMLATIAAYGCMVLEAYVILRATALIPADGSITLNSAVAVETFSRVASFASAFIPANLGALEASSLAAASAVGAVAGGAALALARRLRGLFWAGIGLAIYPRSLTAATPLERTPQEVAPTSPSTLVYVTAADDDVALPESARLAGLPIAERVLRSATKAGYGRIMVWAPLGRDQRAGRSTWLRKLAAEVGGSISVVRTSAEWANAGAHLSSTDAVTVIGPGTVVSPALLAAARAIMPSVEEVRDVPAGGDWPESGVLRVPAALAMDPARMVLELRARRVRALPLPTGVDVSSGRAALALRATSADSLARSEETIRRGSYKDTDATVARFNRRISLPISVALIRTPLTANQLSVLLVAVGLYSAWLFSIGHYWTGVLGAFLSLAASVLDGCDGEIARLKYQESALGCWIETVGDYSYYIAIFVGLTVGVVRQTGSDVFYWLGGASIAGSLLTFGLLIYLRTRITAGQPEKLHAVARARFQAEPTLFSRIIWRVSFVATRSTMPYGIMAFSLFYGLPAIVVLAAIGANIYWISLLLKLRHLLGDEEAVAA